MRYWMVRITELVVFEKGEQEIESLILMEAEDDHNLATMVAARIYQMKEENLYVDDVEDVGVQAKELTHDDFVTCSKYINKFSKSDDVDDHESRVAEGMIVPDTLQ